MEEILASIRRIIADDQSFPGLVGLRDPAPPPAPAAVEPPPAPEPAPVHVLRPEVVAREPAPVSPPEPVPPPAAPPAHGSVSAPQFAGPAGPVAEPPMFAPEPPMFAPEPPKLEPVPEPRPVAQVAPAVPEPEPHFPEAPDMSEFDSPLGAAPPAPAPQAADSTLFSAATGQSISSAFNMLAATRLADNSDELLSMVREMIRPLLKVWLDDNLPSMVERLVRAEIERVSRGGH